MKARSLKEVNFLQHVFLCWLKISFSPRVSQECSSFINLFDFCDQRRENLGLGSTETLFLITRQLGSKGPQIRYALYCYTITKTLNCNKYTDSCLTWLNLSKIWPTFPVSHLFDTTSELSFQQTSLFYTKQFFQKDCLEYFFNFLFQAKRKVEEQ